MVILHFRLSEIGRVETAIERPMPLREVLDTISAAQEVSFDSTIVVRRGRVLTADDMVSDNDVLDILPAISGG